MTDFSTKEKLLFPIHLISWCWKLLCVLNITFILTCVSK